MRTATISAQRESSHMKHPMPTLAHLRKAHEEFKRIEPRDFFYWSVTKLVAAVLDTESKAGMIDELVRALMMLLMTWNKNYYRFKPKLNLEEHFAELEAVISKHFDRLIKFRNQRIHETAEIPEQDIRDIFKDFTAVLGRVGAAKCLHLLAPGFFPLWDAAILKGYGMEKKKYRHQEDEERYVAFIHISKVQIDNLGDFSSFTVNPLKSLDEYNYCLFTKNVDFD
jgi:hypothetical protein